MGLKVRISVWGLGIGFMVERLIIGFRRRRRILRQDQELSVTKGALTSQWPKAFHMTNLRTCS